MQASATSSKFKAADPDELREWGGPVGTTVEVRQLFHNTPVRRKFLKTTATEFGHISEQFARVAIAHPRLHAVLRHNGKPIYELPATNRLIERLELFHGSKLAEHLIWIESETDNIRLWGYVGHPSQSKSSRKSQYLFLNGRYIQDRALQHALSEAYRGLLMTGRQPISFLFLEVPPEIVDVNVHPTKSEVRFRDGQQLYRQMLSALRTKFLGMDLDTTFELQGQPGRSSGAGTETQSSGSRQQQLSLETEFADWAKDKIENWQPVTPESESEESANTPAPSPVPEPWSSETESERDLGFAPLPKPSLNEFPDQEGSASASSEVSPATQSAKDSEDPTPRRARVMQVLDCYLVMETEKGLVVVDQHALHERVLYEQFRKRVLAGRVESQKLLVPQPIEMSLKETALLLSHRELLAELGFGIEEFGSGTILLTAYPALLAKADHARLIRDVVDQLDQPGRAPNRRDSDRSALEHDGLQSRHQSRAAIEGRGNGKPVGPQASDGRFPPLPPRPTHGTRPQPGNPRPPIRPAGLNVRPESRLHRRGIC